MSLEAHVLSVLKLQTSSAVSDLEDAMKGLSVRQLKAICTEMGLKKSGNKAELIGRLLTTWQQDCGNQLCDESGTSGKEGVAEAVQQLKNIERVVQEDWKPDFSCINSFTFSNLYNYLVNSRDKSFDKDSMKAYKSLKAYKYFDDNLVQKILAYNSTCEQMIIVKCHCFSSLKAKKVYETYVVLRYSGEVLTAKCACVAGKGQACSHVDALLFYIEDCRKAEA
jgi:hypothetical protein